jgi:ribosomal protein L7Ae-like RNA K-turn-binding protein
LADTVVEQLLRRCLDLIGLARRAGQAVFGFAKVESWLRDGKVAVLLAAHDGDPRDRARLRTLDPGLPTIETFTATELAEATGRERTVHGALAPGRLAETLQNEAARFEGVRYGGAAGRSGDPEHGSK